MANMHFKYTPVSGGSEFTVQFDQVSRGTPSRLEGYPVTDAEQTITKGGTAVTIVNDTWFEYEMEVRAFTYPVTTSATSAVKNFWRSFKGWLSHAQRGGEFKILIDSNNSYDTTMSGAEAQGQTVIGVASTGGMAADEWVYLEDTDDATKWEKGLIASVGASDITLASSIVWSYASGSVVRYHEYFPACVLLPQREPMFQERQAGQGANLWDLKFKFRTVR